MTTTTGNGKPVRPIKIGMVGIGVGGAEMLPILENMPEFDLMAGADINPRVRDAFAARYEAKVYPTVEELCNDPDVEAIWVSTPNRFHAEHSIIAANHGKHVVVEKPMALNLDQASRIIEAADKNGVKLLAGHTRSFTPAVRAMRRIVKDGKLGQLRAINVFAYTDWMLRPRTAEELDINQGGGIPYRQGPHQIDSIRVIGGGMLRSVRAMIGDWFKARTIPGYYASFMEFEDGTPATAVHNGYGYFMGGELVPWGHPNQRYTPEERVVIRKALREGVWDDEKEKDKIRIGGENEYAVFSRNEDREKWVPEDLGVVLVSCDNGDIRHSAYGLYIYDDDGQREIELTPEGLLGPGERRGELVELYEAVRGDAPIYHTGEWGMATLEVCLAIIESAKQRKEIMLQHQVPVHPDYDQAKILAKEFV